MSCRVLPLGRWFVALLLLSAVFPADAADGVSIPAAVDLTLQQRLMAHGLVLRGEIDGRPIQLRLGPKLNEDGLEGQYFFFGSSAQILVAGEVDGDDLAMEESLNGRDVSGQWEGHRQGQAIVGSWTSADGAQSKPFSLQLP